MDEPRLRVLAGAFAPVPGCRPHGAAMLSMIHGLRAQLDLISIKTEDLAHLKRIGEARMFRVPVAGNAAEREGQYARALARQLEAEPYDVVHAFDPWAGVVAAQHRSGRALRLIYEPLTFPEPGQEERWRSAHAQSLRAADRVIVPTEFARARLRASADAIDVVPPSVDPGTFDWFDPASFATPRVLYLGAFQDSRDLETLLAALVKIADYRPVRVMLAGETDAERRASLRLRVALAGLGSVVDVRGEPPVSALPGIVAAADVCVAPGVETKAGLSQLPQPFLEYLACGRATVAANVGGIGEIVRDEHDALLYRPGDEAALSDAILELLRDGALRERIAENGYGRARTGFTSGARRRRLRAIYEELAPGSQWTDPWRDDFDEITGRTELEDAARPGSLEAEPTQVPPRELPIGRDTREEPMPRLERDTHPSLAVPDTDPGTR